ncbi:MAG TPA: hypothetical protein VJT73_16535, partial [Polyangiaceae bacterium]|nr:hypothetical protein [Polyangiaceae bacterium]
MSLWSLAARRACFASCASLVWGALSISHANAAPSEPPGGALALTITDLKKAVGAEKYAALRTLWRQWDQTDPSMIEEAIVEIERDKAETAPLRAYASMLAAYARRRRGDLDGARAKIRALGVVDRWMVLGPFDNEGKEGLERVFAPEQEFGDAIDPMHPYQGKERSVRWRSVPDVFGFGWLDLGDLVRPREKVCVYATTFVRSKGGAARAASIWAGASGAFKLFWNGDEVLVDGAYRDLDADRFGVPVALGNGWNRLTAKVCGDDDGPM